MIFAKEVLKNFMSYFLVFEFVKLMMKSSFLIFSLAEKRKMNKIKIKSPYLMKIGLNSPYATQ